MAEKPDSPHEVDQFVLAHIDSVPHLELLLLLWKNRPTPWSAEDLGARLYVEPDQARKILQDLDREDLVTALPESPALFRYNSKSIERDRLMEAVAVTYSRELVRLSTLIHSKASLAVREFARAFRFTKEKE
jgi:predicted ArsR family transcriptional regulator